MHELRVPAKRTKSEGNKKSHSYNCTFSGERIKLESLKMHFPLPSNPPNRVAKGNTSTPTSKDLLHDSKTSKRYNWEAKRGKTGEEICVAVYRHTQRKTEPVALIYTRYTWKLEKRQPIRAVFWEKDYKAGARVVLSRISNTSAQLRLHVVIWQGVGRRVSLDLLDKLPVYSSSWICLIWLRRLILWSVNLERLLGSTCDRED